MAALEARETLVTVLCAEAFEDVAVDRLSAAGAVQERHGGIVGDDRSADSAGRCASCANLPTRRIGLCCPVVLPKEIAEQLPAQPHLLAAGSTEPVFPFAVAVAPTVNVLDL